MVYDVKSLLTLQWVAELEGLSNYRLKRYRVLTFITVFEKGLKKCEKNKNLKDNTLVLSQPGITDIVFSDTKISPISPCSQLVC